MTGIDENARGGRFGAATPGARPRQGPSEASFTAPGHQDGRLRARRRLVVTIVGALAVAGAGYAAGRFLPPGKPPPQLSQLVVTSKELGPGARLTAADLRTVTVHPGSGEPPGAVSPAAAASLIGLATKTAVPQGTFLERSLVASSGAVPNSSQALVGLALKPGMVPAGGLADGEQVFLVLVRSTSSGVALRPVRFLSSSVSVWFTQGPDSSGTTSVSVVVPAARATELAGFAARGEVAVVATGQA
jgi:hypothetical protein